MGVSTREQDNRTWLDTDLPLSLAAICWAGIVGDGPSRARPPNIPVTWCIASPLPGSTQPRPACRGDDVMACIAGEESGDSLWLLRCTPCDSKPGRRSCAAPGFAGVKRQPSTAGSVYGRSRSAATCSESSAPSCVDRPLASAGSAWQAACQPLSASLSTYGMVALVSA